MRSILERGLTAYHIPYSQTQLNQLEEYAKCLVEKNKVMNLTAITEPSEIARLHFLDCAYLITLLPETEASLVDVGTGAGFPGMVLKILKPNLNLTLLDSLNKRIDWLTEVSAHLGLDNVTCIHARAEELSHESQYREQFDFVTTRAVAQLNTLSELCLPYLKVGGTYFSMKGPDCGEEVSAAGRSISILGGKLGPTVRYTIPETEVTHCIVPIGKINATAAKYPRRFAKMQKSPL